MHAQAYQVNPHTVCTVSARVSAQATAGLCSAPARAPPYRTHKTQLSENTVRTGAYLMHAHAYYTARRGSRTEVALAKNPSDSN
jgi:hypothetical protein